MVVTTSSGSPEMAPSRLGLRSYTWRDASVLTKLKRVHRKVGPIYLKPAVRWLELKGYPVPPPRSTYSPELLFNEQFYNYFKDVKVVWDKRAFNLALRDLKRAFPKPQVGLTSLPITDTLHYLKPETNSGLPLLIRKKEDWIRGKREAFKILHGKLKPLPCVAFYRTQPNKSDPKGPPKVRLVWGYPLAMTILEATVAIPIMDLLQENRHCPYPLGYTGLGIAGRLQRARWSEIQFCMDWSKFDSTVPRKVLKVIFDYLKSWFIDQESQRKVEIVADYFFHSGILMPDGKVYVGRRRGIPSGSLFTQIVGSMANYFLIKYLAYRTNTWVDDKGILVFGDDSVIPLSKFPNLKAWAEEAGRLGMTIHPDKQVLSHGAPHFLGHFWEGPLPWRPLEETYQALATSERHKKFQSSDEYATYVVDKALALIIDNAKAYHAMVDFLAFFLKMDIVWAYRWVSVGPLGRRHVTVRTGFLQSRPDLWNYSGSDDKLLFHERRVVH
ncbi:MAG: RdRP [aquatic viral metagenome]